MGNDYMVAPDVVVYRETESDDFINEYQTIVDGSVSSLSDIRKNAGSLPILHASVSAKWTMRSDCAQNSRTEALGLIRNRKGHLPHIVVVTGEPMPARIASLALGTGDIDCVYHFALYELVEAVKEVGAEDSIEMLNILIKGKRLKDVLIITNTTPLPLPFMGGEYLRESCAHDHLWQMARSKGASGAIVGEDCATLRERSARSSG